MQILRVRAKFLIKNSFRNIIFIWALWLMKAIKVNIYTISLSYIHCWYTHSEQPVQTPNWVYWCYLAIPKWLWMQMQHSSFSNMHAIRAYCQLDYCVSLGFFERRCREQNDFWFLCILYTFMIQYLEFVSCKRLWFLVPTL